MIDPPPPTRAQAEVTTAGDPPIGPAVTAVVPAWGRAGDVVALFGDLARLDRPGPVRVVLVDNGTPSPLSSVPAVAAAIAELEPRIPVRVLRLPENRGGSGGFNAGLVDALRDDPAFVWLVDSDARVEAGCLRALVNTATARGPVAAVGTAIADPQTGRVFETGARLDRRTGRLVARAAPAGEPIEVDYAAACCLLVPADAVRRAGLLPDLFVHSDDVAFCLRLREATGRRLLATPAAVCRHPRFDRYKTWARYYEARNWIVPVVDAGLGTGARVRRAWREVVLAVGQALIGRDDLAQLHLRGLRDAAGGRTTGRAPHDRTRTRRTWPMHALMPTLEALLPAIPPSAQPLAALHADAPLSKGRRHQVRTLLSKRGLTVADTPARPPTSRLEAISGLLRTLLTPPVAIAVVNAKAPPHAWSAGRIIIAVSPEGFSLCRPRAAERVAALANAVARGTLSTLRLALMPPAAPRSPTPAPAETASPTTDRRPTLSIIILTRDRIEKLLRTLGELEADPIGRESEIIVVDNDSSDGTPVTLAERFPRVRVIETRENLGVQGFNVGVDASRGEAVLILDDDAWPADGALAGALDLLRDRSAVAGVMLHRRHPRTKAWEWPFDREIDTPTDWPDMGSGNIIRRSAWDAVGGYEAGYFLYRNDTDLALKLLAAGHEVVFAREHHVWHDSPIAHTKSAAWLWRSTRNWMWLAKRHGRRGSGVAAALLGWLWAHRLAGLHPVRHAMALRGAIEGMLRPAPTMPAGVRPDGRALRRLIALKLRLRG